MDTRGLEKLIVITAIYLLFFGISAAVAFLLFTYLPGSNATAEGGIWGIDIKAGGAFVGFIISFIILHKSYTKIILPRRFSITRSGAKATYEKGIALGDGGAAFNLGVLLEEDGDRSGAKAAFQQGIALGDGGAAFNLGVLLEEDGDRRGAKAAYKAAVELMSRKHKRAPTSNSKFGI
jgi:TPR repeat protein